MERTKYFTEQFKHYIESIRNLLQNQDKDIALLSYYFLRMLETKARLERYGEKVENSAFSSCCEAVMPYRNSLLEHYEQGFGLFLPEKVLQCARRIHDNLEILAPDSENTEEQEEEKEEILEEAFFMVIEEKFRIDTRGNGKIFPQYDFFDVLTCLDEISYTFEDIYYPEALQEKLQEYVQENKVDIERMPWFYRPSISEIPLLLNYEMQEIQSEVILEDMEKNPLQKSPEEIREWLENCRKQNQPSYEEYGMAAEEDEISMESIIKEETKRERKNDSVDQDAEKKSSEEEE